MDFDKGTVADRVTATLARVGGTVRVRNAVNPALWALGVTFAGYTVAVVAGKEPPLAFTLIASGVAGVYGLTAVVFLFRDPDRLQSEDYLLKRQSLTIILEKGTKQQIADVTAKMIGSAEFASDKGEP